MNEIKLISQEIGRGGQDLNYQEVFNIGDNALKINIKSDSYGFQCHAKVSWLNRSEHKWNVLHSIHHSNMKTESQLHHHPQARNIGSNKASLLSEFWADREELVRIAQSLI
jgi:hypothetical protein